MRERALIIHVSQHLKEYLSFIASHKEVELQQATSHWDERERGREEITLSAFLCEHVDVTASSRLTACAPFLC